MAITTHRRVLWGDSHAWVDLQEVVESTFEWSWKTSPKHGGPTASVRPERDPSGPVWRRREPGERRRYEIAPTARMASEAITIDGGDAQLIVLEKGGLWAAAFDAAPAHDPQTFTLTGVESDPRELALKFSSDPGSLFGSS